MKESKTKLKGVKATIQIDRERCKGCGLCVSFCPLKALALDAQMNAKGCYPMRFLNPMECSGCMKCVLMCPDLAIRSIRKGGGNEHVSIQRV